MSKDWTDWQQFVVNELMNIREEISSLKAKSKVWGMIGGAVVAPLIVLVLMYLFTN